MILAPRYIPRLASTIGLFTNYGLRDFAKNQGLLSVQGAELATDGDDMVLSILITDRRRKRPD